MKDLLKKLYHLAFFTKNDLRILLDAPANTLDSIIFRLSKNGDLIQLKNGYYTTQQYYNQLLPAQRLNFAEFIAGILYPPSYLSLEYVLTKHNLLTEGVLQYTSVSLKKTNFFENQLGTFTYKNIQKSLFTGFETRYFADNKYYEATKAKALFDYTYYRLSSINPYNQHYNFFAEQRINTADLSTSEKKEFQSYVRLLDETKFALYQQSLVIN